jgi:glutaredoxin-related protein
MAKLTLFGTLGCHLCEQAEAMLRAQQAVGQLDWKMIDIADSDALIERYGVRIPVLLRESQPDVDAEKSPDELGWPFTDEELAVWLNLK